MLAIAGAAAVALAGVLAGTAAADPSSTPPDNAIVGVAAPTLQVLADRWFTDYDTANPVNPLYFWDGTGPSPITPKGGCSPITRPNGANADITALNQNVTVVGPGGKTYYCIDLALVDRAFNPATDGADVFVLFAHDAITWAANKNGHSLPSLTPAQLASIYSANTGSCLKWSDVGGTSTNVIKPVLPQAGSGTRSQWLKDLGVTTPGTCVINASGSQPIEENEGTNCVFWASPCPPNTTPDPDVIVPFSVGSYLCQVQGPCPNNVGDLELKQISGVNPTTGSGTSTTINPSFPPGFIRGLYAVTRYTGVSTAPIPDGTGTGSINLRPLLGDGDNTGWICGTTAQSEVAAVKFLPTSSATCGAATHG
jgi:hypothetical protein